MAKPIVFIGWSGEYSRRVASTLRTWIRHSNPTIETWMSDEDIAKGSRWSPEIAKTLENTKIGIFCLTPQNLDSIWMHFEAGAISKMVDESSVCAFLLGLKPATLKGPFTQFQLTEATRPDFERLYAAINKSAGEAGLDSDQLADSFHLRWPQLEQDLTAIAEAPEIKESAEAVRRDPEDMLTELLERVRRIEASEQADETQRIIMEAIDKVQRSASRTVL